MPAAETKPEQKPAPIVPAEKSKPAYEDLGRLPEAYGTRRLFLVARDPYILFAYWDLSPDQYKEAAGRAHDGKIFLEVYVDGGDRVAQIHVWESHKNWYLQLNRPSTSFFAQLGYYRQDGRFEVLARSASVITPRDTLSPNVEAKFVTIPIVLPFTDLFNLVKSQILPGEELADALHRLQQTNFKMPFAAVPQPRELTTEESNELLSYLADEEVVKRLVGSFEISEILRRRFELLSSSEVTSRGEWGGMRVGQFISGVSSWSSFTSVTSPFGASFGKERGFHMHVNAELIIYGGTEPNARLRVDGQDVKLSPDGTFHYHFVFPDGGYHIPIEATSADGVETRGAMLSFLRATETSGDVQKTGQPKVDEPIGRVS